MDRLGSYVTTGGSTCPYSTDSSSSAQSYVRPFDTIRALHETIVSLRTALEESRQDNDRLRKQISVRDTVEEGRNFLRNQQAGPRTYNLKKFDNGVDVNLTSVPEKKLKKGKRKKIKVPADETEEDTKSVEREPYSAAEEEAKLESPRKKYSPKDGGHRKVSVVPDIQIASHPSSSHSTMASRIDVKIKVSSNINVEGSSSEAESSEITKDEVEVKGVNTEAVSTTVTEESEDQTENVTVREEFVKGDASNLKINLVNEENLCVSKSTEGINIKQRSSENLHIDVDRSSNPSISEGDNSVFTEDVVTPVEQDQEGAVGFIKPAKTVVRKSESENQEEVDDIELIFSSNDSKEIIQEDLVSISDYEPWQETGQSGTPILLKFRHLSSDQETSKKNSVERSDSDTVEGDDSNRDLPKGKSIESQDSFGADSIKKSLDFSTKSSSLEKDSSLDYGADNVRRDDSFEVGVTSGTATLGKRWTNYNVLIETDISKCGIAEENILEMGRRNTCPNPPAYRPIIHTRTPAVPSSRNPLAVKFSRSPRTYSPHQYLPPGKTLRTVTSAETAGQSVNSDEAKRSRAAQTDITALSQQWRSETHLSQSEFGTGLYTLPSKFVPPSANASRKYSLRPSDRTQEARRVLLSDINFTSMVPELSRSADHLCQQEEDVEENSENQSPNYCKGNLLKTPETVKGIPPSYSMNSPGVSQWTVNESSIATQTTQTEAYWGDRGDSFDSSKSYSLGSRYSTLSKHHRSRSVPSIRCAICRQGHQTTTLRPSESMHYTPRVTFQEPSHKIRGSLPDLRHDCNCPRRYGGPSLYRIHGDSGGSTDSLLEEAEEFLRRSIEGNIMLEDPEGRCEPPLPPTPVPHIVGSPKHRRCSENDIQRDYIPSKHSLPFLPKTAKCLKPGHLAKVISRNGRVVVGRVRYIGPLAGCSVGDADEKYVGLQLPNNLGDCDGSMDGKKFFDCEPLHGIFVPFKKVVMAWNS
ncbi:uncharacterized protein LOC131438269 [Malaya genurostris]|uniref:uncharacterized protein LOC131438269 n=1 Tax=Malaya genurostris TaxID=325434 RepID=UPI0026F3B91D|nr:uncharacterized protein LOC131438269 [Malaya genurostris]XP_058464132.1 uncharacterized protein LOC131438269 [Malaya genurostris]